MHPYKTLPKHCFWRQSIAEVPLGEVDPVVRAKFKIAKDDKIATAGSCFAQHIARHLKISGFNFLVTEDAHPLVPPDVAQRFGYGMFTARYGNVYTSRQFLQLIKRAYGLFQPIDDVWQLGERLVDPFRPQIEPGGFFSMREFQADRNRHLMSVRKAVEEADIFVFTLGLTETWVSRADGAAYPLCPGVAGGTFDRNKHQFLNLRAGDIVADMIETIDLMRTKNRDLRFILTVSPVPLIATAEDRSVLVSTTYSKAALRVACEEIAVSRDLIAYFPSFEIITGNYNRGVYYAGDMRSVTETGVSHVMRLFMQHYTQIDVPSDASNAPFVSSDDHQKKMENLVSVLCDEEALAQ